LVKNLGKRIFDIIVSLIMSIVLSPIMAVVAVLIIFFDGRPIIFRQNRLGLNGNLFIFYKFRTMTRMIDAAGKNLSDEQRLTRLGKFLRKSSLDELPSLWNVLNGDMSIVGPRPLLEQYKLRYNEFQNRRHEIKPGMTGLAQVKGRNSLSWEEKFKLDVLYVDKHNIIFDLKIFFMTVLSVLRTKGITPGDREIMSEFMGTKENEPANEN